jgi:hypothetical protein
LKPLLHPFLIPWLLWKPLLNFFAIALTIGDYFKKS